MGQSTSLLDLTDEAAHIFAECTTIHEYLLRQNKLLTDDGVIALASNPAITLLSVAECPLVTFRSAEVLASSPALETLSMNIKLSVPEADRVFQLLGANTNLTRLFVEDQNITLGAAQALAANTHILHLGFSYCEFAPGCIRALGNNKTLKSLLILGESPRCVLHKPTDVAALAGIPTLVDLNLTNCGLEDSDVIALADAITAAGNIKRLDISKNQLSTRALAAFRGRTVAVECRN